MCGIVGIWHKKGKPVSHEVLSHMRDEISFRGPDDCGIWVNGSVGFGHRRLSIIDLSSHGRQPMYDSDVGVALVCNGEVYNYQALRDELMKSGYSFKSESDSEVILYAYVKWGFKCVERLEGMFAFAIWDERKKGLFLARDRIGIKPLYYYDDGDMVMFSSRLSPFYCNRDASLSLDTEALGLYLDLGFIPNPYSIFKKVKKISPGHTLWIDNETCCDTTYWSINSVSIDNSLRKCDETELVDRLDVLLQNAVRSHLVADVPLGAFLSGGIDSSLVTAIMASQVSHPVKTFTIGFEEKQYDESSRAKKVASYLGVEHHERIMRSDDLLTLLDDNVHFYDEPFADYSSLPTMMLSRFAREQVTVCLSGDGGDELFGGYVQYRLMALLRHFYKLPVKMRAVTASVLALGGQNNAQLARNILSQKDLFSSFVFMRGMLRGIERNSLFTSDAIAMGDLFHASVSSCAHYDDISKALLIDSNYYLSDDILQKLDVASMACGLEGRVPMLDYKIVEFAQSLPNVWKIRGGATKYLLRKVLSKYVPPSFFDQKKQGFVPPVKEWFRHSLREMICDELSESRIRKLEFLNPKGVSRLLDLHLHNMRDTHHVIWALFSLVRWHDSFTKKRNEYLS